MKQKQPRPPNPNGSNRINLDTVTLPANAAATTVFLEQFTAAMGALREKNCDLAHLLKVQEIPHLLLVVVGDKMNALNQNDKS